MYPAGVEMARFEICGAPGMLPSSGPVATQTRIATSQVAPAAQSPSPEQDPRLDVRQAASGSNPSTMRMARMEGQNAKVRAAPAASRMPDAMKSALAVWAEEFPEWSASRSEGWYAPLAR